MLPIYFLAKFIRWLCNNGKLFSLMSAFFLWVTGMIDKMLGAVVRIIVAKLQTVDISAFQNGDLNAVEYIGYVNAVFPVSEFLTLSTAYITAWIIVIGIRWIKSFIPSIGN